MKRFLENVYTVFVLVSIAIFFTVLGAVLNELDLMPFHDAISESKITVDEEPVKTTVIRPDTDLYDSELGIGLHSDGTYRLYLAPGEGNNDNPYTVIYRGLGWEAIELYLNYGDQLFELTWSETEWLIQTWFGE